MSAGGVKRIQLLTKRAGLGVVDFQARFQQAFTQAVFAPSSIRPVRAALGFVLHEALGCEVSYDVISMEWFEVSPAELPTLWRSAADGGGAQAVELAALAELLDAHASATILADELVLRGSDWLSCRWLEARVKYKHMALARRAHGLSAAEFSARWRDRPGRIGGGPSAPVITIPDAARGHAYVQNHPRQCVEPSAYDAINEVYFDELASMSARIEFLAQHDLLKADSELISQTHFAVVCEHVIDMQCRGE